MVSYSLENLPSVSCINYHERDDIDLLDDLTHENGHHHLNYFLRTQELIYEDDQEIFYSPWRRTLRPIRGLYHATFTFFYASQLFYQLSKLENNDFNKNELKKIHNRFCQEFLMIESTRKLLDHAFKLDKISPAGKLLIEQVLNENLKFKPLYDQLQASFTQEYFEDFLQVKNELKANLEKYHKKLRIELI
jgi:HEXXH motif-containing protein